MDVCSRCGKPYTPSAKGWMGRVEGLGPAGRVEAALRYVLLCPEDAAQVPPRQRMAWHEYTGRSAGPTREKRPGHLGESA